MSSSIAGRRSSSLYAGTMSDMYSVGSSCSRGNGTRLRGHTGYVSNAAGIVCDACMGFACAPVLGTQPQGSLLKAMTDL